MRSFRTWFFVLLVATMVTPYVLGVRPRTRRDWLVANTLELKLADSVVAEVLMYSLLYGGLPYAALAIWATWWIGGRSEREIRRLMFRAPFLMAGIFVPLALVVGLTVGAPRPWAGVAFLGLLIILPLGYAYVGATVLLRRGLGPPPSSPWP